jgi:hypothetical protein
MLRASPLRSAWIAELSPKSCGYMSLQGFLICRSMAFAIGEALMLRAYQALASTIMLTGRVCRQFPTPQQPRGTRPMSATNKVLVAGASGLLGGRRYREVSFRGLGGCRSIASQAELPSGRETDARDRPDSDDRWWRPPGLIGSPHAPRISRATESGPRSASVSALIDCSHFRHALHLLNETCQQGRGIVPSPRQGEQDGYVQVDQGQDGNGLGRAPTRASKNPSDA